MNTTEQPPAGSQETVAERDALRKAAYNAWAVLTAQRAITMPTNAFDAILAELAGVLFKVTEKKVVDGQAGV